MDDLESLAERRVGTTMSGWAIERVIGVGAMASVVLGRRDGYAAALKVLHPGYNLVKEIRKRFLREGPLGAALATLNPLCDGIPRVIESGVSEDGSAYLAMELLSGETVWDLAARLGSCPVDQTLSIADQVLDVLVVAHSHGIVHRDLKPENLFLNEGGRVKVLDFGIAQVRDPLPPGVGVLPEKTATKTGMMLGTCDYMAPEQARGLVDEVDGRTDVFGLGATMFRLIAGRTIHGDLRDASLLIAAATKRPPPLASVAPAAPAEACAVVDRALAFVKTERYPDAFTMRTDVRAVRARRKPPYVTAVAEGRVAPGAPL
jgi:serine/threonine protein kinase